MKGKFKRMKWQIRGSLVSVYLASQGIKGKFLRYETPEGLPCDENGVELGIVNFRNMPLKQRGERRR